MYNKNTKCLYALKVVIVPDEKKRPDRWKDRTRNKEPN